MISNQQHCCMSQDNMSIVEQLVKLYLQIGFSKKEILALLAHKHSVVISIRPLELYSEVQSKVQSTDVTLTLFTLDDFYSRRLIMPFSLCDCFFTFDSTQESWAVHTTWLSVSRRASLKTTNTLHRGQTLQNCILAVIFCKVQDPNADTRQFKDQKTTL